MKVAILTPFQDFNEGYSLAGIVKDQITMLQRYDNEVTLFTSERFNRKGFDLEVEVRELIPFAHLIDYQSANDLTREHTAVKDKTRDILIKELQGFDIVFEHDMNFQGWHLPYGQAIIEASEQLHNTIFLHWVHSIPSGLKDFWNVRAWGSNHRLVFPNKHDAIVVAEQYRGGLENVVVIPHIKDMRTFFDFCPETCEFIDEYPAVMQADIVQILPASTDKLSSKKLAEVVRIFANLKKMFKSVCLVVANQFATTKQPKQSLKPYIALAKELGLEPGKDFIFTSKFKEPAYEYGISKRMVRELFLLSNLFVFPTWCESFGLVVPEASLAGGVLLCLNKSLQMQMEISGFTCQYFDFGSYTHNFAPANPDQYFHDVAQIIKGRILQNEAIASKAYMRQRYNFDHLYINYYEPTMKDLSPKTLAA